jgi:hypothetical protein
MGKVVESPKISRGGEEGESHAAVRIIETRVVRIDQVLEADRRAEGG